jgi:hypothetical protein
MTNTMASASGAPFAQPEAEQHGVPAEPRGLFAIAVGFGLLLYYFTAMPSVGWMDSAMFQFRTWHNDLAGELGLVLAHPLYIVLTRACTFIPIGDFAFRVNLCSVFCGAFSLGFCASLLWRLTRSTLAAAVGTLVLAVSHTFWTHSVIAEVYNLYALGLLIELWLLHHFFSDHNPKWFVLAVFVTGVSFSNHALVLLHGPAYVGVLVWAFYHRILGVRHLLYCTVAFLLGSSIYLGVIGAAIAHGQPALEAFREAFVGSPKRAQHVLRLNFPWVQQLGRAVMYFGMNFPTPLVLLAPVGFWQAWKDRQRRWFVLFASCVFVVNFFFAIRYLVPDQYVFYTPGYVVLALFVGLGVPYVMRPSHLKTIVFILLALLPALAYEVGPPLLRKYHISFGMRREIPFRDNYRYFLRPRKNGDYSAYQYCVAAMDEAGAGNLLIADETIKNSLAYVRDVMGVDPEVILPYGQDCRPGQPAIELSPESVAPFVEQGRVRMHRPEGILAT